MSRFGCYPSGTLNRNGALQLALNGETLLHRTLPRGLGIEVLEWAAERDLHTRVFVDGRIITSPDTPAALEHLDAGVTQPVERRPQRSPPALVGPGRAAGGAAAVG